jgi:hypothetical protein
MPLLLRRGRSRVSVLPELQKARVLRSGGRFVARLLQQPRDLEDIPRLERRHPLLLRAVTQQATIDLNRARTISRWSTQLMEQRHTWQPFMRIWSNGELRRPGNSADWRFVPAEAQAMRAAVARRQATLLTISPVS